MCNQDFQPEHNNSKILGNAEDRLAEDTLDSISSMLSKEIEGKIALSNPRISATLAEGKDSMGESSADAQKDLQSATLPGSLLRDFVNVNFVSDNNIFMEVDRYISNKKRKTTDYDGNGPNSKLAR